VIRILKEPQSMNECVYFTRRELTSSGKAVAWVFKQKCIKCQKALMGKPVVKGKVKIRAHEYVCPECGYTVPEEAYEESLTASIIYTCQYCSFSGETEIPYKRKKVQMVDEETGKKKAVETLRFPCGKCGKNIDITKKMKG
jgi:predicted RNA-binding Zn-ribbon protein involved in translation (DUF1610 family)